MRRLVPILAIPALFRGLTSAPLIILEIPRSMRTTPLRPALAGAVVMLVIMALILGMESVAHAQSTAPTVSTVSITSNPGSDNTYATGDTITVSVTFSGAVTVSGLHTPRSPR